MDIYLYVARELPSQKKIKGEMKGEDEEDIYNHLVSRNLYPEKIIKKNFLNTDILLLDKKIKISDISFFCKQLETMLQAGISLSKALELCINQSSSKIFVKHLKQIYEKVNTGHSLSKAIEEERIFPLFLVHLIACGEQSGKLDQVMRQAVGYLENQMIVRKKIKKAATYPSMVLGLVGIVLGILMVKVVPSYMTLLNDTGAPIPLPTKIVIQLSDFLRVKWPLLIAVLLSGYIVLRQMLKIPCVNRQIAKWSLKCPLVGKLIKQNLTATFTMTLSMLLQSGISIIPALEITKKVMNHSIAEEELDEAIRQLKQGATLIDTLSCSQIFPELLLNMIHIGQESGELEEVLAKMGTYFRGEVESLVDQLILLIEPTMMIIVAIAVGGIMASIILPTFSAATSAI